MEKICPIYRKTSLNIFMKHPIITRSLKTLNSAKIICEEKDA